MLFALFLNFNFEKKTKTTFSIVYCCTFSYRYFERT